MSQTAHLPALLSREFGIAEGAAATVITSGNIEIGGQPYVGDPMDLPCDEIMGKEIVVWGEYVSFRFTYTG